MAALGHLGTPNQERGVFKTTDGGRTWQKQLFVNDTSGAVDLVIDSARSQRALCGHVRRDPPAVENHGSSSRRRHFQDHRRRREVGEGEPTACHRATPGRIGIDICRKNPDVIYAVIDNFNLRPGAAQQRDTSFAAPASYIGGEVYRTGRRRALTGVASARRARTSAARRATPSINFAWTPTTRIGSSSPAPT